jgi:hypothetical protein
MSRPPETLSPENLRTIAEVRRDVWTNGIRGLAYGSVCGYGLHTIARIGDERQWWTKILTPKGITTSTTAATKKLALTPNTAFLSLLLGGAVGSYLMAVTAGKNAVHRLHDIFEVGAQPPGSRPPPNNNKPEQEDFYTPP